MTTVTELLREEEAHERQDLVRGLKDRHVQLIAIGGAIGVGLFLGSATGISRAGPGLVVAYAVGGLAIFFIMRALGELLLYRPVAGSFASYAEEFVGPWAGFTTGWSYWFMWVVTGMAEITAVAVYVHYWFPDIPQWIPALIALAVLYAANLIAVHVFGELEFSGLTSWSTMLPSNTSSNQLPTSAHNSSCELSRPTCSAISLWPRRHCRISERGRRSSTPPRSPPTRAVRICWITRRPAVPSSPSPVRSRSSLSARRSGSTAWPPARSGRR
jgi:Amino acid permease